MVARGFTVIEALVGLAVLVLIATCVTAGDHGQRAALLHSLQELQDSRRAATVIERLRGGAEPLVAGTTNLDGGTRTVRRVRNRLYEVRVEIGGVSLVTWIAKEDS